MRINKTLFTLLLILIISSCSTNVQENSSANYLSGLTEFIPPNDPGMVMYRSVVRTPSWEFKPKNQITWNTALYGSSYGVSFDDDGRIIKIISFWEGRRSDALFIKDTAPAVTIEYLDGSEIVSLIYTDSTRFSEYNYQIQRDEEGFGINQFFLDESGNRISVDGVAYIRLEPQAENWYSLTSRDETGNPIITRTNPLINYKFNEQGYVTAYEYFDSLGNNILNDKYCYRFEMRYNESNNLVERRWINLAGTPEEDAYHIAWERLELSTEGLALTIYNLDSLGNVNESNAGVARTEFQRDQYGRSTSIKTYNLQGEPTLINGVWELVNEYDDKYLISRTIFLDTEGNLVDNYGYAEMVSVHDSIGNPTNIFYWDFEGNPGFNWNGVHWHKFSFDEHSRLIEMSSWNPDGSPGLTSYGAHIEKYILNPDGSYLDYQKFDENGELID